MGERRKQTSKRKILLKELKKKVEGKKGEGVIRGDFHGVFGSPAENRKPIGGGKKTGAP